MEEIIPIIVAVIGTVVARVIKSKMNDATQTPSAPIPNTQSPRPRSLEDVLSEFDFIGFTLQYELSYTNVLNMLDLAGLPVRSKDRTALTPIVIAGGACVCNSEPMAEFFDITLPGDGEEVTNELIDLLKECKAKGATKQEFLVNAAQIKGVYVPSLYEVEYNEDGTIKSMRCKKGVKIRSAARVPVTLNAT